MKRSSGILMHISSLHSPYGIGTFGTSAYEFVDFLDKSGQSYWQVLPLNPTSYGDSPYQSPSAFAGNPNFIDFDLLKEDGILREEDYQDIDFGKDKLKVDYGKIFEHRLDVLRKAFENVGYIYDKQISRFKKDNEYWIEDYAEYMAIKYDFDLKPWYQWDQDIRSRESLALDQYRERLKNEIKFWIFIQYIFYKQWTELKEYANEKNINIIGDIPIYIAEDSVDLWTKSEYFLLDEDKKPIAVAGVPPDDFSDIGQFWGNPLYDWKYLKEKNYDWWIERIRTNLKFYDILRLDHFRGFESYWSIPNGSETAIEGKWEKGPEEDIFKALEGELGKLPIIIEDLGQVTDGLISFKKSVGYPSMKVMQFAFSSGEKNDHLPHCHEKNQVVYTGTHDNQTIVGWINDISDESLDYAKEYLILSEEEGYDWGIIRGAWSSVAVLSIAQMQDFLGLDDNSRMNTPNTQEGNWQWRVDEKMLSEELAERIRKLTKTYNRLKD